MVRGWAVPARRRPAQPACGDVPVTLVDRILLDRAREGWYVAAFLAAALTADVLLRIGARLSR